MKENDVICRRFFRGLPLASPGIVIEFVQELERRGVDGHTGADYERAFSLYTAPDAAPVGFRTCFDVVFVETTGNKGVIDAVARDYARQMVEITGRERDTIEEMIGRQLYLAHSSGMTAQRLPAAMSDDTLRPYQMEMKNNVMRVWKYEPRIMLQMPTGTGKTRLFVSLVNDIRKGEPSARILIVTHRKELVEQTSRTLSEHYRLAHGIVGRGKKEADNHILIASIQKLARMKELPAAGYIIIDEAHHSPAPSYRRLVARYPSARMLGVTATPYRLRPASFNDIFGTLLLSPPVRRFINDGFLSDYRLFTVSDGEAAISRVNRLKKLGADGDYKVNDLQEIVNAEDEIEKLYDYYKACAFGKRGIVYAVSRDHAERIANLFNTKGICAVSLDCTTPAGERKRTVAAFKSGRAVRVLVNVELFTEGFDCPDIEFVMLARPTRSLGLYLQQVGRALRPFSDGGNPASKVVIIDAAGLYNRFGSPGRRRDWGAYFRGECPSGEDYNSRPLGTPGIEGLMKEMTGNKANALTVKPCGNYSVCDFGGGKWGLCDNDGRKVFPLLYERISSYAGVWFVGERRSNGKEMVTDILVPQECRTVTFSDFREEGDGVYSVGLAGGGRLRFDRQLRLVPASSCETGGMTVYRHGDTGSRRLYTLSLRLGSRVYDRLIRYVSGLTILTVIGGDDMTLLCRGEEYTLPQWGTYDRRHFFSDDRRLYICTDGTVFRRIAESPVLYRATGCNGVSLCDKHLHPLCSGDYMETAPGCCVIYKGGKPFRKVSFVDYLCSGGVG